MLENNNSNKDSSLAVEIFPKILEEVVTVLVVMTKENFSEFSQACMFSL